MTRSLNRMKWGGGEEEEKKEKEKQKVYQRVSHVVSNVYELWLVGACTRS